MGKIAFIFPGQGAQYIGMGKPLYDKYAAARQVYDTADAEFVKNISWSGTKEDLTATKIAQPAIFLADLAAAAALNERGISAAGAAGFSLGEIPALAFCGLLDVKEAFKFVCFRAEVMHECTLKHKGGMMAVLGLSDETVKELCQGLNGAYPVNFNSPGQVVVAYSAEAGEALKASIVATKGKVMPLTVAGAFHSPLMDDAAAKVADYLTKVDFSESTIPLYSNVTAKTYNNPKELLAKHVNNPVLWQATIKQMITDGYDTFIETGPGKTLTGMIKKIDKNVRTFNVFDEESLEESVKNV